MNGPETRKRILGMIAGADVPEESKTAIKNGLEYLAGRAAHALCLVIMAHGTHAEGLAAGRVFRRSIDMLLEDGIKAAEMDAELQNGGGAPQ